MAERFRLGVILLAALAAMLAPAAGRTQEAGAAQDRVYQVDYRVMLLPDQGSARVRIQLRQERDLLREMRLRASPEQYQGFEGDGEILVEDGYVTWRPPARGGSLSYTVLLDNQRRSGAYDSRVTRDWALFRGDDLVPPATVRSLKGARSRSRLRMSGPEGWSFLTPYREDKSGWSEVVWPERNFDRPVGWMVAGRLTVRWADIAGVRLAVAGPMGQGVRAMDILAFLRWNLPTLVQVFPNFPSRIVIVSAGDPMWRGGLSGPNSMFLHADRPLISNNGTSTLLHELMHLAQGYAAGDGDDWIVEGIAEYYTLEILHRSGTLSERRYTRGHQRLETWGEGVSAMAAERSTGARTARAVAVMQDLDQQLRQASKDVYSLDDVARRLSLSADPVTLKRLRKICKDLVGKVPDALSDERVGASR